MDMLFIKLTNGYTIYQIIRIKYIHIISVKFFFSFLVKRKICIVLIKRVKWVSIQSKCKASNTKSWGETKVIKSIC